jgi:hypothetical protein
MVEEKKQSVNSPKDTGGDSTDVEKKTVDTSTGSSGDIDPIAEDFEFNVDDLPEQVKPLVEKKIKEFKEGYHKAYIKKTQNISEIKKKAETVDALARQYGFRDFWHYLEEMQKQQLQVPSTEKSDDVKLDETENLLDLENTKQLEIKMRKLAKEVLQEELAPREKVNAIKSFANKYKEFVVFDENTGQIFPTENIEHSDWLKMRDIVNKLEGKLSDMEVLEIALSKVVFPKFEEIKNKISKKKIIKKEPEFFHSKTPVNQNVPEGKINPQEQYKKNLRERIKSFGY